jgi:hypothetical protein
LHVVRRHFYEIAQGGDAPLAEEALRRIAALFGIERTIRGQAPEQRRTIRLAQTTPLLDDLRAWLEAKLAKVSGGSRIARAIRYALKHWAGLTVFLDDGRVEIDSNMVERAIRPNRPVDPGQVTGVLKADRRCVEHGVPRSESTSF